VSVPLDSVVQNLAAMKENPQGILATINALLAAETIANRALQVDTVTDKIVFYVLDQVAFHEKLITYDATIWDDLLEKVPVCVSQAPWLKTPADCRLLLLQTVAATAAVLEAIWPMPAGTAAGALSDYIADPTVAAYVRDATLTTGENAAAMALLAAVTNPFEDVGDKLEMQPVEYCILGGDFNVEYPDLNVYSFKAEALLAVQGSVGQANAYTSLTTAPNASTARAMALDDILTTCQPDPDQPYQYIWDQAGFNALKAKATKRPLSTICAALATLQGNTYCGVDAANVAIKAAFAAAGLPVTTIVTYRKDIVTVFPATQPYNGTEYVGANAYDNFGCQYPVGVANPITVALPSMLSMLGSWKKPGSGSCTWAAAAGQLTSVVQPNLTKNQLIVNGNVVAVNLPTVVDAARFYFKRVSDHFPIAVKVALP
jgi:hypothetical protein